MPLCETAKVFSLNDATLNIYDEAAPDVLLFEMIYVQDVALTKEYDIDDFPVMNSDDRSQEIVGQRYNFSIAKLYFSKATLFMQAFDKSKTYRIVVYFREAETLRDETYTLYSCMPKSFELVGRDNDTMVARMSYQPNRFE